MSPRVRPATRSDAAALARVHAASWRWAYEGLLPSAHLARLDPARLQTRWARRLRSSDPDETFRVLEVEGVVEGFIAFGPSPDPAWLGHAGEVSMLYLNPTQAGRGLGRALFRPAVRELVAGRCYWLYVWVLAKNERARRFYERQGLKPDGARRWEPFGDRAVPVIRYACALNPVFDFATYRLPARP